MNALFVNKQTTIQIAASILMIIALAAGRPINYPDNVADLHGFPLVWGTHQLVTIAGPVDTWRVSITMLIVDLVIWLAVVFVVPFVVKERLDTFPGYSLGTKHEHQYDY